MKYLKGTGFLEPYVNSAKTVVPLKKLVRLRAYKVPLTKTIQTDGWCNHLGNGKYEISLRLWGRNNRSTRHETIFWEEALHSLAHELAHLKEWDHTPEHYELQARIMLKFTRILREQEVPDIYINAIII